MTPWLALSLGLWLGQMPEVTPPLPPDADTPQAQGTAPAPESEPRTTDDLQRQVDELRTEVQTLQSQLAAQQQQDAVRAEALQQQLADMKERAETLEDERQQRLDALERAAQWLAAADKALEAGELDIGDTLREADAALAQVVQSATDTGSGQTAALVEDARDFIAQALSSTGNRDTSSARWDLFDAAWRLHEARRHNLDEASATTVTR